MEGRADRDNCCMPSVTFPRAVTQPTPAPAAGGAPVARPDPLAVTRAGTGFKPVDTFALKEDIARALRLGADVPGRVQDGPTCGLYALGMAMDLWDSRDARNAAPLVQSSDVHRWDSHSRPEDSPRRLLDVARQEGFTSQGEMFHARQLASLARQFGYTASTRSNVQLKDLHAALDQGHPVLVPFDVDDVGNPGLFQGTRAHWCVVEGHFHKDGVEYVVATHGWTGREYVWRAEELLRSNANLKVSDFPGAPADISRTLGGKAVVLSPGARP
jgi:hypothetical protein